MPPLPISSPFPLETSIMFWFFPYLQGRDLDYREYFALIYALVALMVGFAFWFLALLCYYLANDKPVQIAAYVPFPTLSQKTTSCLYELNSYLASLALTFSVCCLSIFDFASVFITIPLSALILGWRFLQWCKGCHAAEMYHPSENCISNRFRAMAVVERSRPGLFYLLLIGTVALVIGFPLVTEGFCLCYYNSEMGIVVGSASLSTRLTRYLTMPESCPPGPPCHVYLTLPEDSSHFVFVNVHTSPIYSSLRVFYGPSPSSLSQSVPMTQFPVTGLDRLTDRYVFSALISDLMGDSQYYIRVEYAPEAFSQTYWFRTMPDTLSAPLRFVAGGDIGNNPFAYTISKRAGEQSPDIGFVGGDLAYDNNFRSCARTWDLLLSQWTEYMGSDKTQLVPMVFSLGNHDVGLESLSGRSLELGASGPLYFTFFPQHFARDINNTIIYSIPPVPERKSYFRHTVGAASFYTLDSGYIADYTGEQLAWLEAELAGDRAKMKFAQYHLPVYPSIPLDPDEKNPSGQALKYWVPLFDEFRFTVVFENHVHSFKRTLPLSCSREDPSGVIYVGDGQWGAGSQTTPNPNFDHDPDIFLKEGLSFHVWIVDLLNSTAAFTAIGLNPGDVVDSFQVEV